MQQSGWFSKIRSHIYLTVEPCNFKRKDGSKQTVLLDSRDFNNFADCIKQLVGDQCTIVYTDTDIACHVGAIVIALRDRNLKALGYYEKMKKIDKQDAYKKWKNDEVRVINTN